MLSASQIDRVRQNIAVSFTRGDFDLNGVANTADVPVMLQALTDLNAYQTSKMLQSSDVLSIGDINTDGIVNNLDMQAFLNQLKNGSGGLASVPEPASWLLLAAGFFPVFCRAKRTCDHQTQMKCRFIKKFLASRQKLGYRSAGHQVFHQQ